MIEISPEIFTAIMLGTVMLLILTGIPVAIVIGGSTLIFGYVVFGSAVVELLYSRAMAVLVNYILLAVPCFVFMGTMLERSGIAEKMYDATYQWFGRMRGGLAVTTIIIGTLMAASIGIIAASIAMLSLVAIPPMMKRGYSKSLAAGTVCAGGSLGILIPPSILLVIYGPMAQLSVGKLFFGAFTPGLLLASLYCIYILLHSFVKREVAPAMSSEELAGISFSNKTFKLIVTLFPTAVLIMSVLGVIFFGIAPPTEAAAVGAVVATLLTIFYRKFSLQILKEVCLATLKTYGLVYLLVTLAYTFIAVFIGGGGDEVMKEFVLSAPGGRWGAFAMIMLVIFILGFFIDWLAIMFILVPIITPIAADLGFDPIWFALMVCINLQMSLMTPPFAYSIFFAKGSIPPEYNVSMGDIIKGVIPFVFCILIALFLCLIFPEIITWLPNLMLR
ncbi:MAG: TRAP transporter large permease [Planctomycetota bacterium]|jgi:tripartite ATP-independent transporter DctM subunit